MAFPALQLYNNDAEWCQSICEAAEREVATAVDEVVGAAGDAVAIMIDVVLEAQAAMVPRWLWDPQGPPCNAVNV